MFKAKGTSFPYTALWKAGIATVAVLLVGIALWFSSWGQALDAFSRDSLFLIRGSQKPDPDILVVGIDEPSFASIQKQWPWPRSLHARLLNALFEQGARVVAIDLVFSEASTAEDDGNFAAALSAHPRIVLATHLDQTENSGYVRRSIVGPHPALKVSNQQLGFINLPVDNDGVVRKTRLTNKKMHSFAFQAASLFNPKMRLDLLFETYVSINFLGKPRTIKTVSYYQALEPEIYLPHGFFKNKLVFIGFNTYNTADLSKNQPDHYPVPFSRDNRGYMAGVEIHAQIADNLLNDRLIQTVGYGLLIPAAAVFWGLSLIGFFVMRPTASSAFLAGQWIFGTISIYILFANFRMYVPLFFFLIPQTLIFLSISLMRYFASWREKIFIHRAFSTYVAPSVVKQLMKSPERLKLGGREAEITAFFSDVEGFTSISESLSPTKLVALLNEFLTEMTDIVLNHEGTVDKFEGDAIIAFFGAPNTLPQHARAACQASLRMQDRLTELRKMWTQANCPQLHMRIGLCSGEAVVGNMGSQNRMDYTMMGDTVNTAARLEGVNKLYGTYMLISESTHLAAGDDFISREIDTVAVVGKAEPIRIYQLIGFKGTVAESVMENIRYYERGLSAYRNQNWKEAVSAFSHALKEMPDDTPSLTMLGRCQKYNLNPPERNWQGVHQLRTK